MPVTPTVTAGPGLTFPAEQNIITARYQSETGTGVAVDMGNFPHRRCIQRFAGTGSVAVQGSNDGTNWIDLKNTESTTAVIALATGTNQAADILETPRYLRPVVTAGTVTIMIIAYL